jgi:thiol-disulfide isomerase/thioredoxin
MRWAALVAVLAMSACSSKPSGPKMPDATLPFIGEGGTVTTKTFKMSSFRGKVLVLDVSATWCKPCRDTLPILQRVVAEAGDGVTLVSIFMDGHEQPTRARELVRELAPLAVLLADDGTYTEKLAVTEIPTLFVVDKDGVVVDKVEYDGTTDKLAGFLKDTIAAARAR